MFLFFLLNCTAINLFIHTLMLSQVMTSANVEKQGKLPPSDCNACNINGTGHRCVVNFIVVQLNFFVHLYDS